MGEIHSYLDTCNGVLDWGLQGMNSNLSTGWTTSVVQGLLLNTLKVEVKKSKLGFHHKMDYIWSVIFCTQKKRTKCSGCVKYVSLKEYPQKIKNILCYLNVPNKGRDLTISFSFRTPSSHSSITIISHTWNCQMENHRINCSCYKL